jgi:tetratricopeptide (TPR) repeat protein
MEQATEVNSDFVAFWHVPAKLRCFTGRVKQLNKLRLSLSGAGKRMIIRHAPQITGTGGIGKTQLAVQFIHEIHQEHLFKTIIWLNADCTLYDRLNTEFLLLARGLKIDTQGIDKNTLIETVYNQLAKHDNVIIVFDSASSYATLEPYLPRENQNLFSTLVTTRDDRIWSDQFEQLPLDIFSKHESLDYIKKVLPGHLFNEQEANLLADCLGRFPLGLAQATGYIATRNIAICEYLRFYQEKSQTRQKLLDTPPLQADPHLETIWVTVSLCLEEINDQLALKILPACAFLSAEFPVDRDLFSDYCIDSSTLESAFDLLRKYSLLENTEESRFIRIHQLVQEIVLLDQQSSMAVELDTIVSSAYEFFNRPSELLATEQRQQTLIPHFMSLLKHLKKRTDESNLDIAKLSGCLGICFHKLGQFGTMLELCQTAYTICKKLANHELTGALLTNIGNAYGGLGKIKLHQEYLEMALTVFRKLYAEDHEQILITLGNLACVYGEQGDIGGQKELLEKVLAIEETKYGKDSGQVAKTLNNLACAFGDLEQYEKMRQMCMHALAIDEAVYGKNHPETATTLVNLGSALNDLKDFHLAIEHLLRAISIDEQQFGSDHIKLADALQNIAFSFQSIGKIPEAIQYATRSLTIKEKNWGDCHHRLSSSLVLLARLASQQQDFQQQIQYLKRAWEINKASFGERHPKTLNVLGSLALSYGSVGQYAQKIELLNWLLQLTKSTFGDNHILVAKTHTNLALSYGDIHDKLNEKVHLDLALLISRNVLGDIHPEVAIALNNLAAYHLSVGDANQAVVCLKKAHTIFCQTLGDNDQLTLLVQQNLFRLTQQAQRSHKPLEIIEQFDPQSKITRESALFLANAAIALEQYESAVNLLCFVNERSDQITQDNQQLLARCYLMMGELDTASVCVFDFPDCEIQKQISIEENKKTAIEKQLQSMKEPEKPESGFYVQKSRRYIATRKYQDAIPLLKTALLSNSQGEERNTALLLLAQCYHRTKEYSEALKCLVNLRSDEAQGLRTQIRQSEHVSKKLEIILEQILSSKVPRLI